MPERVTTSFIPKEALAGQRNTRAPSANPFFLLNIVAAAILFATVVASVGLFLFQSYTAQSIAAKNESLNRQRSAFEPATILELLRLEARIGASEELLGKHTALSLLFDDLEARTNTNVRFRDFSFDNNGAEYVLTMDGIAKSFNAVALQSDSFGKSTLLSDPIFSNLNLDDTGNVVFNFTATVEIARINYALAAAQAATAPQAPEVEPLIQTP